MNIDKKTLNSFRKTLAIYAEKYSSYHTINMYNRFHELVVNTQLKTIDTYTLLNWKANLGKEREWHLGSLKGFLLSWYEYGYYGVDKAVSERTGEIIHVNARRFRHTRGTNLGRKGVGATSILKIQLIQCNTLIVL